MYYKSDGTLLVLKEVQIENLVEVPKGEKTG